jgi:ankyrin repeat protein
MKIIPRKFINRKWLFERWQSMTFQAIALLLVLSTLACSTELNKSAPVAQESPKEILAKKGLSYSEEAFIESVKTGDVEVVNLYLAAGMSPNTKDSTNKSALTWAIGKRRTPVAHTLIVKGADIKEGFKGGATLLILAAMSGNMETVRDLLSAGANPNEKDVQGHTPLIFVSLGAMLKNMPEYQPQLQKSLPKDISIAELLDQTENGYSQTAGLLVDKGANPNAQADDGETALMFAAISGDTKLVKTLLDNGADPTLSNKQGSTALQLAISLQRSSVIDLLRAAEQKGNN